MTHRIHPVPFVIHPPLDMLEKLPELRRTASRLANMYVDGELTTLYVEGHLDQIEQHLQTMGRALWSALALPQADFDAAIAAAGEDILPVIIAGHTPAVQALPWETLFHPLHGFIGKHPKFTLSRQLSSTIAAQDLTATPLAKGPLRVLLFSSLPDDVDAENSRLNLEEEQAQLQEALLPWIAKGLVQLEIPDDGRFSTLQTMLKEFEPHLLFLSGHGCFHHEPHTGEAPYGVFGFESEIGKSEEVRQEDIARALMGTGVQAVVLSACESSKNTTSSDALNHGLAQCISAHGIAYVIGMRESIYDVAGIAFARALCDALAGGERIDFALQSARIAMQARCKQKGYVAAGAAEPSDGQWCLPMLISSNPGNVLIDWHFQPIPIEQGQTTKTTLGEVLLPERFIGRRKELRQYKNRLLKGELHHLLITAPGGQGKTALAGKLAMDMQQRGWQVFTWRARPENSWREFLLTEMQMLLSKPRSERYDRFYGADTNEFERAKLLLELVMEQFDGRVILFLDNLESLQNPDTKALDDAFVAAWLTAARATAGLILLATSRWNLPDWDGAHITLEHANYGDFLQMALRLPIPDALFENRELRRVYAVLGGNCRGLEFFSAAVNTMGDAAEEQEFLGKLAQVKTELQADMAIAAIVQHLRDDDLALLQRLPVFAEAVPIEGIVQLGSDLPEPEVLLQRLLAVSLVETGYEAHWKVMQYRCSPLVADWLGQQGLLDWAETHLNVAADYHLHLFQHERNKLGQAIAAHDALRRVSRHAEADRLTLDAIVGRLTMNGFYGDLLDVWLPRICESENEQTRAEALAQTGKINLNIGDCATAIRFMEQALSIQQHIGDKKGEGSSYNNISQVYHTQCDYETALTYLKQALSISQQVGDKASESGILNNIATRYQACGDYEKAFGYLEQAITISKHIGDLQGIGQSLTNLSGIYRVQGDLEMAADYLKQALTMSRQIGDKANEAVVLNNVAALYQGRGDYETALDYLKQALVIQQSIGDKPNMAATLNNIAALHHSLGNYQPALDRLEQVLAIYQQIGDKAGESNTLNNISQIWGSQGDYETALVFLKQALVIQKKIGDKGGEGNTLNNISQIYQAQGNVETALTYLKQALLICQQSGDKARESAAFNNLATLYHAQGDNEIAFDYLKQALVICQHIDDKVNEASTLGNISQIYHDRNDYENALVYVKQALAITQQAGAQAGEATALNNISQIYYDKGDIETALIYQRQALIIYQHINDKTGQGVALNNMATYLHAQGDAEMALNYLKQALAIHQLTGDSAGICSTLFNIGHMHMQNEQIQDAATAWVTVYNIAKEANLAIALQALADLAPHLGMPSGLKGWEHLAQQSKSRLWGHGGAANDPQA